MKKEPRKEKFKWARGGTQKHAPEVERETWKQMVRRLRWERIQKTWCCLRLHVPILHLKIARINHN